MTNFLYNLSSGSNIYFILNPYSLCLLNSVTKYFALSFTPTIKIFSGLFVNAFFTAVNAVRPEHASDAADAANKKMDRDSKPDSISAKYAKATKQQESLYKHQNKLSDLEDKLEDELPEEWDSEDPAFKRHADVKKAHLFIKSIGMDVSSMDDSSYDDESAQEARLHDWGMELRKMDNGFYGHGGPKYKISPGAQKIIKKILDKEGIEIPKLDRKRVLKKSDDIVKSNTWEDPATGEETGFKDTKDLFKNGGEGDIEEYLKSMIGTAAKRFENDEGQDWDKIIDFNNKLEDDLGVIKGGEIRKEIYDLVTLKNDKNLASDEEPGEKSQSGARYEPATGSDSNYVRTAVKKRIGDDAFRNLSYGEQEQEYEDEFKRQGFVKKDGKWVKKVGESVISKLKNEFKEYKIYNKNLRKL